MIKFAGIFTLVLSVNSQAQVQDPCQYQTISPRSGFTVDVSALNKALQLSPQQRLRAMCEMKTAVMEKYVLVEQKQRRLGINVDEHMSTCALKELSITSGNRSDFFDRAKLCIAGLKDTHFGLGTKMQRPHLNTVLIARWVENKLVVGGRSSRLIAAMKQNSQYDWTDLENILTPGNEILTIDGVSAKDVMALHIPYQEASSEDFAKIYAATSIFDRDYLMPKKNTVTVEILFNGTPRRLTLPWWSSFPRGNTDGVTEIANLKIPNIRDLTYKYNPETKKYEKIEEELFDVMYSTKFALPIGAGMAEFLDDDGEPALRLSQAIVDRNNSYCYMQLLTFHTDSMTLKGSKDKMDFFDPISAFLADCEKKKLPLLLDLRRNGGGNGNFPGMLMGLLAKKGQQIPRNLEAYRTTQAGLNLISNFINPNDNGAQDEDEAEETGSNLQVIIEDMMKRIDAGKSTTNIIVSGQTSAATKEGFNQKIVALVSPQCISACDMMAQFLKISRRATLMGTHANGTGAGFSTWNQQNSNFEDTQGLFSFEIPNHLFGIAPVMKKDVQVLEYEKHEDLLMENKPVQADIQRPIKVDDLIDGNEGFLEEVLAELL